MKQRHEKLRLFFAVSVILITMLSLSACKTAAQPVTLENVYTVSIDGFRDTQKVQKEDGQPLEICRIGAYTGTFVEQGTDIACRNVNALIVCNRSGKMIEKAVLTQATATYTVTFLPPDGICLVQEQTGSTQVQQAQVQLSDVIYAQQPSMHPEHVQVQTQQGEIRIENISGEDIPGSVNVWYKTKENGLFMGGVSYKAAVDDGVLFADSTASVHTAHFDPTKSVLLLVTFSND